MMVAISLKGGREPAGLNFCAHMQLNLPSNTCSTQVGGSLSFSTSLGRLYTYMFKGYCLCSKDVGHSLIGTDFKVNLQDF